MVELISSTILLIFLSGLWSGTEAALFSINTMKARQWYASNQCSKLFLYMVENKEEYVSTLVVLNNIVNISGSIYVGLLAAEIFGTEGGIFSGVLTLMIIIFAENIPKAIGGRKSKAIVTLMARPLYFSKIVLHPLVWIVTKISNFFLSWFFKTNEEESISEHEIEYMVSEAAKDKNSEIRENEAKIIKRVFDLYDLKAVDIMTPRVLISYLKESDTLNEVAEQIKTSQHSRLVVIGDTIDDVIGITYKEDLLIQLTEGNGHLTIGELKLDTVKMVSESISAEALMRIFKSEKKLLSVVQDEHGGVSGVVTLEDVLEILVGEIVDETDQAADLRLVAAENKKMRKLQMQN